MASRESTDDGGEDTAQVAAAFRFVSEVADHSARSHAMREHWKHRRQKQKAKKKREAQSGPLRSRTRATESSTSSQSGDRQPPSLLGAGDCSDSSGSLRPGPQSLSSADASIAGSRLGGVRSQALQGMNIALSTNQLDPFDQFPIKFTPEHHKLLHHC